MYTCVCVYTAEPVGVCTRWTPTHLTGQVPLRFGCQEGQRIKTQFKPFRLLVFPAAFIQFLRGFRRREIILMQEGAPRLCNDLSRRPQEPQKPYNRNTTRASCSCLKASSYTWFRSKKQKLNSRSFEKILGVFMKAQRHAKGITLHNTQQRF